LVITLLIITTLVGLTVAFSEESNIELSLAGYSRDSFRAHMAALAGCEGALALIHQDEDKGVDSLGEEWARFDSHPFLKELPENAAVSGEIIDENSKFNLNALINPAGEIDEKRSARLERLFILLGLHEEQVSPLLDWLDEDDEKRLHGAENDYYRNLPDPYDCANGPFLTVGQISLVKGMSEDLPALLEKVTIYGDGKINVNTASREVLQCLDEELDSSLADAIIDHRSEEGFRQLNELKGVSGMSDALYNRIADILSVKSSGFSIRVEGSYGEAKSRIEAVVLLEGGQFNLTTWRVF
jgi:general secretion pathway protein K